MADSSLCGPGYPGRRAAALSLAVVTFRERASAEALEQFCKSLSAGGFLKLVQNTLLQLDFAPARKQPCPSVCIVASDDQSDEGEPSSLEDDEEAEDLPALRSPDPTSSFAVAVPSLELAALNPQARSQVGAQSSSLSRTREDLLDRFDRMLELVREHNVTESVSDARPSASSTSFADQFADLSSDEEASDNESEMVSETSGEQETVVRFRQRSEPKTLRAVSFQRYLGKPVHVADIPPSKLEWTITGSRPGMVLVGPSEECLREKAEQVELENFAEFHMGDLMWELVARSVGNCEASKARTLALLEKAGDQIYELPSKRLHHMVYILAMDSWSAGYGESQCAVLKHFFKTEWTPPEVSWDWDLGHRTRLAHHQPYEIEAETSTGAALRAFVKRVSHRELSALTGNTESASLLKLGVSNGCESTSLPFCELPTSREAQLGWLARFVSDHAQLRREKKEREAQAHLAALQGLVAGQSTAPGIRLGALVIMHGLVTSVNAPLYSSLDVGLTDALVRLAQSGQDEEERSSIVLASVSLLERIARCRRKNERILGDEQHLAMCSMSQMPSNLWFYGTCSALLWNTTRANLLSALSPQIDRVPGLGLNLVVAFTAAQRVNREFVRSHIAILVAALEQAIGDEECGLESPFYAAAAKALLPLAVSVLHSDSSLETVQALLGILAAHTKEKKYLRTLDLSRGGICGADLVCLESVVGTRGFEEIELSHNPSIGDDGATTVASWLAKPECNIRKLQMAGCGLGVRGFKRLADALRCPGHLTDLDLAGNAITEDGHDITGVLALAESLIWNTTLQQLDLSSIVLTQEGLTTLTRALRYNGALSCLRLEDTGASPLQLGAVYEKLALNRSGATSSPHLGRGSLKKLPRLAREKARQTARILSGPNLAHLPYERSKGSGAKPRSSKGDVQTESLLEAFVRDTVRLENVNTRTEDSIEVTQEGKGESTATELYAIMQRIQDLKARQDALFVGTQTQK
ncbi:NACHT, LRR and PYD domains-containing protein 5 [Hondaea fermentalgiana]|uniref:NACHT, LRR and PYD domains-containing protein 5 n=1 Tax=Hondaea fermentalgiana TaxID=2315210 RepID=A0A2R5GKN1_9STRA|nr:NACHT, LRR and PYD domains-containing protein 5 [Hondaea fermentalgiana]|eukprot:GBG31185.1 NACHT, LRR and PYD domains-containing protein 5 [Hondaea fermentalgiana]